MRAPPNDEALVALTQAVHDLAMQRLAKFNAFLQQIGASAELQANGTNQIDRIIKWFQQRHTAPTVNELESILEALKQELAQMEQFAQRLHFDLVQKQLNVEPMSQADLLNERRHLVDSIKNEYMKWIICINKALILSTDLAIHYVLELVLVRVSTNFFIL